MTFKAPDSLAKPITAIPRGCACAGVRACA